MISARLRLLLGLLGWLVASGLLLAATLAHDFWIAPDTYRPAVNTPLDVRLFVGHVHDARPYTRNPNHIQRFVAHTSTGEHPVEGTPGQDPAGTVTLSTPGLAALGYVSHPGYTTLSAGRFASYLAEEGLTHVLVERAQAGESEQPGREAFSRSAKALVAVGDAGPDGYDRVLGLPLELVPEANPYTLAPGAPLPVRLLYEGRPLADVRVTALHKQSGHAPEQTRTDAEGRVVLTLSAPGPWLIKALHMTRTTTDPDADWHSLWATLTFER